MGLFDSWSVKDFNIHLASTTLVPGQMVNGNITFTVTGDVNFRKFSFKLIGREFTHVAVETTHGTGKNRQTKTTHYYENRNFFKIHVTPLGMPKWGGNDWKGTLAPGTYNFPFAARLPLDAMPTMINSGYQCSAAIQYFVKAKIDIPFGTDSEVMCPFRVETAMPVSQALSTQVPYNSQPLKASRHCCCCFDRGFTTFTFSVDRLVLIFGRDSAINGHVTIDNSASKEAISEVKASIIMVSSINAKGHARVAMTPIANVKIPANVQANQQGDVTIPFQIPVASLRGPDEHPLPCNFRGVNIYNHFDLNFSSGTDLLGQVSLTCASAVDECNGAMPVQVEAIMGSTVPKGMYPRFIYAPPPGSAPQVPLQQGGIGPFNSCQPPLAPIPY